jgi:pimeloyl-ACP methyl ester carboxylesterase
VIVAATEWCTPKERVMSTCVAVAGSGAGGWYWDDVVPLIEQSGHDIVVVDRLPSNGRNAEALGDLTADTAHVRGIVDAIDGSIVLAGHSYGGMILTELADHPAVRHSIYIAALWPQRGQSVADLLGGDGSELPAHVVVNDDGTWAFSDDVNVVRQVLFPDVDEQRAAEIHRRLVPQALAAFATPSTAPDRTHSTTFVITEHDKLVPAAAQEAIAQQADHVVRVPTAHTPMFSAPDRIATIINDTLDSID